MTASGVRIGDAIGTTCDKEGGERLRHSVDDNAWSKGWARANRREGRIDVVNESRLILPSARLVSASRPHSVVSQLCSGKM